MHHVLCRVFWWNIKSPRWLSFPIAQIRHPVTSGFSQKLKLPLKGKRFQTFNEIQENTTAQLMVIGRTVWGPKVPALKGTEISLSYIQCFLYLLLSSINVSTFHITWLDTFWTDHIHKIYFYVIYNVLFKAYRKIRYRIHNCRTSGQDGSIGRHGSPLHTITSEL